MEKIRNSPPKVFLAKGVLKICSKFTGEHPCRSVISVKLLCNFIETTLRNGCSPVNLLHVVRTPFFYKNTTGGLLLKNIQQSHSSNQYWKFIKPLCMNLKLSIAWTHCIDYLLENVAEISKIKNPNLYFCTFNHIWTGIGGYCLNNWQIF